MQRYYKNSLPSSLKKNLPKKAFVFDQAQVQNFKAGAQIVLALAAAVGVVAVSVIAPNALKLFKTIPALRKSLRKTNRPAERIAKSFYYLKSKGYIRLIEKGGEIVVEVTQEGRRKILEMDYENLKIPKPKNWDGKWWFVFADIPTKEHRTQANSLRRKIKRMGLYPLQRTVWVYPFDPQAELAFVCGRLQIDRFVTVLRADKIDPDDEAVLTKYFKSLALI